ncbi:MAG: hypothetical protein Q8R76_06815 [Candidatus Omnitrophota bacterium]|nr:hypothetical protein [Candidatus Omnitrophota bacterium]
MGLLEPRLQTAAENTEDTSAALKQTQTSQIRRDLQRAVTENVATGG